MKLVQKLNAVKERSRTEGRSIWKILVDATVTRIARLSITPLSTKSDGDPYHLIFRNFVASVNSMQAPKVLEIGSRARSGNINTELFSKDVSLVGLDILPGPNVDIVGDAHALSSTLTCGSFDALFCISVFEHLGMPWKAVLEMNKVLKPGGQVFIATHPIWPLHDQPWDFFRFSSDGFRMLFNRLTGFEIIEVSEGLPCRIFPLVSEASMKGMERNRDTYLGISMRARKVGEPDPRLKWDIGLDEIIESAYPK